MAIAGREGYGGTEHLKAHLERHITDCERELDDDAESIVTNQRYLSASDKIDRIVTNRVLALPIFVAVMFLVYAIAIPAI